MKLIINNCDDIQFILYLIRFLNKYIINSIDDRKLQKLDTYLTNIYERDDQDADTIHSNKLIYKNHTQISSRDIIEAGARSLEYKKFGNTYVIIINKAVKWKKLDAKLCDLCKLINYGTISVEGYPIFTESFNYVADHIDFLHYKYYRGF